MPGRVSGAGIRRPGRAPRAGPAGSTDRNAQLSYVREAGKRAQGPPIKDYDELGVEEVSERLEGLCAEEIREVNEYERRNKNRETLLKRMHQKLNAS